MAIEIGHRAGPPLVEPVVDVPGPRDRPSPGDADTGETGFEAEAKDLFTDIGAHGIQW